MLATKRPTRKQIDPTVLEPSTYLTDGPHLYRVLRGFSEPVEDSFALLEDCRTLDAYAFEPDELWGMHLQIVRTLAR